MFFKKPNPFDDLLSKTIRKALDIPKKPKSLTEEIFDNFNVFKSFENNVLGKTVTPIKGSVIYCVLTGVEHSGVYVGGGKIVHLDGSGKVESVTPKVFLDRLDGLNQAITVYVSCDNKDNPVGSYEAASRARMEVGKKRKYSLVSKNCHQFTAGCLTGNFEISCSTFSSLKKLTEIEIGFRDWKAWESSDYQS